MTYLDPDGIAILTPCLRDPQPFDILTDRTGPAGANVVRAVLDLGNACPIKDACWADNADEPWMLALQRGHEPAPCGTARGYAQHIKAREKPCTPCRNAEAERSSRRRQGFDFDQYTARLAAVKRAVRKGLNTDAAAAEVGLQSRQSLYGWCRRNGQLGLWRALMENRKRVAA